MIVNEKIGLLKVTRVVRKAFTLLEILVVMALIGVMTTFILSQLSKRKPNMDWLAVTQEINNLLLFARQEAIASHKVHRLVFRSDLIFVEEELINKRGKATEYAYRPVASLSASSRYELPAGITIDAVYAQKKDSFKEQGGQAFCYIVPDGLIQPVKLFLTRVEPQQESKVTIQFQTFLGECTYQDGHHRE